MKYRIFKCFLCLLFPVVFSCVDDSSEVGSKWVSSSFYNVLIDTCTVHLSTILADSINTSGNEVTQIGCYSDDYRGVIRGTFFTEYNKTSGSITQDIYRTYVFDSLTISFTPSGDYLGDTLAARQNISIHRLIDNVTLDSDNYLYNVSSLRYNTTPLATFSYLSRPKSKEKFEVRLPDELGKDFFKLIEERSMFMQSQEYFRLYFPGLAILPDNNGCITGFAVNDTSMCMTMYYREIQASTTEYTLTFTPNSSNRFNQAIQNFTNTPFDGMTSGLNNAMSSKKSRNVSYLQGLTGLYTKIEFPYLNNLRSEGDLVTIESAILYLYPVRGSYGDNIPLPQKLTLYTANQNDVTIGTITDSSGESSQEGNLVVDDLHANGTCYSFDITSFMQSNLGTIGTNRQNLMLMLPNDEFVSTFEGLILGDVNHTTNNVRLQILYKVYNR